MNLLTIGSLCLRTRVSSQMMAVRSLATTSVQASSPKPLVPEFWEKNEKMQRPISPYVIYKPQITTVLSITHRISGLGLGIPLYALGISQLFASSPWVQQLDALHAYCPATYAAFKLAVLAGISYHTLNGIRHLSWDLGYGFSLKQLYASGYTVVGLSVVLTILAAAFYM
jgi:succinate dehydrogenase cytochrome b556 subunit